ncbi:MAG: VOC family protein [Flavobacteriaceae bacterium]|nr:VOC family protein [Flavobacteriaceae bacterium]
MFPFDINYLDHVAIRVKDMAASVKWYEQVLGLKTYRVEAWGDYPVFMLKNKSGIALFPAKVEDPVNDKFSKNVKIDHFAFNVSNEAFIIAQDHLNSLNIDFNFQDHTHFHSIYMSDPDGHTVELTTLLGREEDFF